MSRTTTDALEQLRQEILGKSDALLDGDGAEGQPAQPSGEFLHAFLTGGAGYLIPKGTPAVLLQLLDIRRLPFSPGWFVGLAHHRGDLVPVFDLPRFFDSAAAPEAGRYLLMVGRQDDKAAFRVGQVTAFPAARAQEIEKDMDDDRTPFIRRRLTLDGKDYAELDLEALFAALTRRNSPLDQGDADPFRSAEPRSDETPSIES